MIVVVKERPILFNGAMVRAIYNGSKRQTRRAVQPGKGAQSKWLTFESLQLLVNPRPALVKGHLGMQFDHPKGGPGTWIKCPYGKPGERLWVRETWGTDARLNGLLPSALFTVEGGNPVYYRANQKRPERLDTWRPSIHMPRAASRLLLEITAVRVERVQAISGRDAYAEGMSSYYTEQHVAKHGMRPVGIIDDCCLVCTYESIWGAINGPESWTANPWVWVLEFKIIKSVAP